MLSQFGWLRLCHTSISYEFFDAFFFKYFYPKFFFFFTTLFVFSCVQRILCLKKESTSYWGFLYFILNLYLKKLYLFFPVSSCHSLLLALCLPLPLLCLPLLHLPDAFQFFFYLIVTHLHKSLIWQNNFDEIFSQ